MALSFETLAVSTIFIFRWKYPNAERPYRCWGYPVLPALCPDSSGIGAGQHVLQTRSGKNGAPGGADRSRVYFAGRGGLFPILLQA
jgi:hypothetical protein